MNSHWLTFQGNSSRTGESRETISPPLQKIWEHEIGDQVIHFSPAVSNGIVYIGTGGADRPSWSLRTLDVSSGSFCALDANSGKVLWKLEFKHPILSSPVVGDNIVYVRTAGNILYALDAVSGKTLWEFKHGSDAWYGGNMLLAGNLLCLYTDKLYLIDKMTGKSMWEVEGDRSNSGSSPALYEGILYLGLGTSMIAYDVNTHKQLWKKNCGSKITLGPVIKDGIIYFGIMADVLVALDINNGNDVWAISFPGNPDGRGDEFPKSYPAINNNRLYIGAPQKFVYCLDARTGKGIWKYFTGAYMATSPVVSGNTVYILSENGVFHALDAQNGEKVWEYKSSCNIHDVRSSPAICDGKIFIGWDKVYAFKMYKMNEAEKQLSERISHELQQAATSNHPDATRIILVQAKKWERQMELIRAEQYKEALVSIENSITEVEGYLDQQPNAKDILAFTLAQAYGNKGICIIMGGDHTLGTVLQGIQWIDKALATSNLPPDSENLLRQMRAVILDTISQLGS